jgi:hypothetical protein
MPAEDQSKAVAVNEAIKSFVHAVRFDWQLDTRAGVKCVAHGLNSRFAEGPISGVIWVEQAGYGRFWIENLV